MKIAYFLDSAQCLGGTGTLMMQRAKLMSELYEVIVVIPCDENKICNPEYMPRCEKYGLNYRLIHYNTSSNFYNVDIIRAFESCIEIEKLVIDEKITFLHSVQLNVAVEIVSRKLNIPHLMDIYQMQKSEFKICPGDFFAHYHLCDSELYSEVWKNNLKINSKCIRPISPLKEICKKEKYPTDQFTIVMIGTVFERKNQLAAIKVIEKCLLDYDVRLLIAGNKDSSYGEECEQYIRKNNLEENIFMLGFLSDVSSVLKQSDCILCASIDESFPSSIVEAVAYDLTVISTPVAGVPEVFKDNYNAFISRDFSEESIYHSVCECLDSYKNGTISRIYQNTHDTWKNNFDRKNIQERLDNYYKEIEEDMGKQKKLRKQIFFETKDMYSMFHKVYEIYPEVKKSFLYHCMIRKILENQEKYEIYIWGAGLYGNIAYELLNAMSLENVELVSFVDKMKEGTIHGVSIMKPEEMSLNKNSIVFISFFRNRTETVSLLEDKGLKLHENILIVP